MTDPSACITLEDVKFSDGISSSPFHWRFFSISMMSKSSGSTCSRSALHSLGQVTCDLASSFSNLSYSWLLSVIGCRQSSTASSAQLLAVATVDSSARVLRFPIPGGSVFTRSCVESPLFAPSNRGGCVRCTHLSCEAPRVSQVAALSEHFECVARSSGAHGGSHASPARPRTPQSSLACS